MASCQLVTPGHWGMGTGGWAQGLGSCRAVGDVLKLLGSSHLPGGLWSPRRPHPMLSPPLLAVTNPCDRKKCEWLCLLSPSGPVCTCPNGKRLDNGTCVVIPSPTVSPIGRWSGGGGGFCPARSHSPPSLPPSAYHRHL